MTKQIIYNCLNMNFGLQDKNLSRRFGNLSEEHIKQQIEGGA